MRPCPRVVHFGYDELLPAALDITQEQGAQIAAVVVPSNRSGRHVIAIRAEVARRGYPVLEQPPRRGAADFVEQIRALEPDLFLTWSYTMLLPADLLAVPRLGALNVHFGLLPEYRGGHALPWAIINGEKETGVTLHYMDAGADTGPILGQARFPIEDQDDLVSLMRKSKLAGEHLLGHAWAEVATGKAEAQPQEETRARHYPLLTAEDGRIDWSAPSTTIANLVRGMVAPQPGAFGILNRRRVVIQRARALGRPSPPEAAPGTVCHVDSGGVRVATGAGQLLIGAVDVHRMAESPETEEFRIEAGDRFEV